MTARASSTGSSARRASSSTRRPLESDYQKTIVATATQYGWYVHAERPAVTSSGRWLTNQQGKQGFPDLVLCHPVHQRLLIVELKRRPNKPTVDQLDWISALTACGVQAQVVYVPEGLDDLLALLVGRPRINS